MIPISHSDGRDRAMPGAVVNANREGRTLGPA
jgi:hypothetical protein